jgi:hypothetical protein
MKESKLRYKEVILQILSETESCLEAGIEVWLCRKERA